MKFDETNTTDRSNGLGTSRRDFMRVVGAAAGASAIGTGGLAASTGKASAQVSYGSEAATNQSSWEGAYTQGPHAEYVASQNTTFVVFRGDDADPYALTYDHDAKTFSNPVWIGSNPLPNSDTHGPPTIAIDDDGILHVFYGCHTTPLQYARSDNAYDISSWSTFSLDGLPDATYTSCCVLNNNVYGFYRSHSHQRGTIIESTDGGDTWTNYTVVDYTTGGNNHDDAYVQDIDAYDGKLYFTWLTAYGDSHDDQRQMPRMAYFDPSTATVYTYDGTNLGSSVTWNDRHQCNVYDHRSGSDDAQGHIWVARHCFDPATDTAYVAFAHDESESVSGFEFKLASYDGISNGSGSWSVQNVDGLTTDAPSNYAAPRIDSDGNVEVHLNKNGDGSGTATYHVATLESDGTWSGQEPVGVAVHKNAIVRNGSDEFVAYASEGGYNVGGYNHTIWAVGTDFSSNAVVVDSEDASGVSITGTWVNSTYTTGYYGTNYKHDDDSGKGSKRVEYTPDLPSTGTYDVFLRWTTGSTRATNVPVDIAYDGGTDTVTVDQTQNGSQWNLLGTYDFTAGAGESVTIRNDGTNGHVIADAVKFQESSGSSGGDGEAADYPIDAGSGSTVVDDSGNGRDGTISGALWATDTFSPGSNDVVLSFGSGDSVETPDDHIRGAPGFTQIAWIRLDSKSDDRTISGDHGEASQTESYVFWYDVGNDCVQAYVRDSANTTYKVSNTGTSISTGTWTMVAWTYDASGNLTVYQNGNQTGSTAVGGNAIYDGVAGREIGADYGRHPSFDGAIHSVVEWTEAKSASFIQSYYDSTRP